MGTIRQNLGLHGRKNHRAHRLKIQNAYSAINERIQLYIVKKKALLTSDEK
jgi:hypothetical protein